MDIKKESLLNKEQYKCLEFLKTWGLNKVEFDENKKIVGITRQSHCDLSTREIELIMRVWQVAKAQAVPEAITIGNELQSWVAVNSFPADDGEGVLPVIDANSIAAKIEKLTGASQ